VRLIALKSEVLYLPAVLVHRINTSVQSYKCASILTQRNYCGKERGESLCSAWNWPE